MKSESKGAGRRIYLALGVILVLLYGLVGVALVSFQRLARATDLNIHTYEVLDAAQEVRIAAVNIQTGYRGFVLTGDSTYLEPLKEGRLSFEHGLLTLRELTSDNPFQQSNLDRAALIHEDWEFTHLEPGLRAREVMPDSAMQISALLARVNPERGRIYLRSLERVLDVIRAEEIQLLEVRQDEMRSLEQWTTTLLGLGGLFGLIAASALATLAGHQSRRLFLTNRTLSNEVGERTRAEASVAAISRSNEMLLQAAGEGICGLDSEGRITFLNPAGERMLGLRSREAQGRTAHDLFHHSYPDGSVYPLALCPVQTSLADGITHAVDTEVFWKQDGSHFPVAYIATPIIAESGIEGSVVTFSDITERRAIEKMKDEFVSVVSHELRTPLTAIRGSLGLLAGGSLASLPDRGQRMIEIASQNTDRLVRLINDILDIERIESGKVVMQMVEVEISYLVEQAVGGVRPLADSANISIETEPFDGDVWGDPDRLIQVLTNLIGNAIKFSDAGSVVKVEATPVGTEIEFTVTDQGRGVPEDKLESIFGRFQQVDASDSRKKGGTGLGLAIARSIIDQHGGKIWVDLPPAGGSRFHFTVSSAVHHSAGGEEVGILICDDDEDRLAHLERLVREAGYRVATGRSSADAVQMAERQRPDAILLALSLRDLDGYKTMSRLREEPGTSGIPVIIHAVQDRPAWASDFQHWLPAASSDEMVLDAVGKSLHRSRRKPKILLAEDDGDLAEVLITMFARHGIQMLHTATCVEATDIAKARQPDLVILDLMLEDQDGFTLVERFRQDDDLRSLPLVVYSALDLDAADRERLTLGPTEFITKGRVPPEQFEKRIMELLDGLLLPTGGVI